jgi:hypothetical protein
MSKDNNYTPIQINTVLFCKDGLPDEFVDFIASSDNFYHSDGPTISVIGMNDFEQIEYLHHEHSLVFVDDKEGSASGDYGGALIYPMVFDGFDISSKEKSEVMSVLGYCGILKV